MGGNSKANPLVIKRVHYSAYFDAGNDKPGWQDSAAFTVLHLAERPLGGVL